MHNESFNRENLKKLAQDFFKTYGYISKPSGIDNAVIFSRPTGMGVSDELLIYFHEKNEEGYLKTRLDSISKKYTRIPGGDGGRRFFLSPVKLGTIPEAVKKNDFKYQVPVWFFDREFSSEKTSTPLKKLKEDAIVSRDKRIGQPYKINNVPGENDLLEEILEELEDPKTPSVRIIVAPAGYGKTYLMEALYTKLEETFMREKQIQESGSRPLLMLPGHIKQSSGVDTLINNFIGDEYDYGVFNKDTFNFLVKNNFAIWLLDGLEELIIKIPDEFMLTLLEDFITSPETKTPQIIIAIRKPVLATLPELRECIDDYEGAIKIYELSEWDRSQKKIYFEKNLKRKKEEIGNFIKDLDKSESLNSLCDVPYYCSLVADLKNNNEMAIFNDECDLVALAVKKLCEREFTKELDKDLFPFESQLELFSGLAQESFEKGKNTIKALREYGDIFLVDVAPQVRENQISCLQRHALLTYVGEEIYFIHDIISQYLTGVALMQTLKKVNLRIFGANEIESDSFLAKYLIKNSAQSGFDWKQIKNAISVFKSFPSDQAIGFRNIMKILLGVNPEGTEEIIGDILRTKNLAGLTFENLNLNKFEFAVSKLDSVKFKECNLSNANFNGCSFKDTKFYSNCVLSNMTTKGATLESLGDEHKMYFVQKEINKYLYERTKVSSDRKEPCQAVINLKRVLRKIVRKGKGSRKLKKFTYAKCAGGISSDRCIDASIRYGILSENEGYVKIKNNIFDIIEDFVVNSKPKEISPILRELLDDLCPDIKLGCRHIYSE